MVSHIKAHKADPALPLWQGLADDLHRLGMDKQSSDALISWASTRPRDDNSLRIRLLHPMEKELLSPESFNDLLELYRLGVLTSGQMENVMENCAYLPSLPAERSQVRKLALRIFADQFQSQGFGPSH